jgi:hypothetical protein
VSAQVVGSCNTIEIKGSGFMDTAGCRVIFSSSVTQRYKHVIIAPYGRARICTSSSSAESTCPST